MHMRTGFDESVTLCTTHARLGYCLSMVEIDPEQVYLYITVNEYPENASESRK